MASFEPVTQEEKYILDLVKFENVMNRYNINDHLYVYFTLDPQVKGSTMDWIGIFREGWQRYESFLAYEWGIGNPIGNSSRKRRIIYDSKYLKDAELETNYQFAYINKHLEILGVSQFFQFTSDSLNESSGSSNLPYISEECWRCKCLFEMKNKHNEMNAKLQDCIDEMEELVERVENIEIALEMVWNLPKTLSSNTQDNVGPKRCKKIPMKKTVSRPTTIQNSSGFDFVSHNFTRKEMLLKAISGNQQAKIKELTSKIDQMQNLMPTNLNTSLTESDPVTPDIIEPNYIVDLENDDDDENDGDENDEDESDGDESDDNKSDDSGYEADDENDSNEDDDDESDSD